MKSKIIILAGFLFLNSCSFLQKPEIAVTPNQLTGKKIHFVELDDTHKKTFNFNKVWSASYKTRFRPYHKFTSYPHTILGIYEPMDQDDEYLVIKNRKGEQYKMVFNSINEQLPPLPSYLLSEGVLNEAKSMIGKTIWLNNTRDGKGFFTHSGYSFPRFDPVTVVDIYPFQNQHVGYPVWLKIKSRFGDFGHVRYNGEDDKIGIQDHYYTTEPLPKSWGKKMIQKVLRKEVELGMTDRQVRISLGNPDELNVTSSRYGIGEQWIYGTEMGKRVYYQFEYGKLTFINK